MQWLIDLFIYHSQIGVKVQTKKNKKRKKQKQRENERQTPLNNEKNHSVHNDLESPNPKRPT